MLLDDAGVIECEYPSINQWETGKLWFRIKTALAEAQPRADNTAMDAIALCQDMLDDIRDGEDMNYEYFKEKLDVIIIAQRHP